MNNDFTDGFEKVAWSPVQGLGQARRALGAAASGVRRVATRSANKAKEGVGNLKSGLKESYNKGRYGTVEATTSKTKFTTGAKSPFTPGQRPTVMRSDANIAKRARWQKAIDNADPKKRAAHVKDRVADVRKKDIKGNLNPFQHKNTAAKVVAGGAAAGAGAGYAGHKMSQNNQNPQRPNFRQQVQQQQVMMRRRAY